MVVEARVIDILSTSCMNNSSPGGYNHGIIKNFLKVF
jgi:hypothetical protein